MTEAWNWLAAAPVFVQVASGIVIAALAGLAVAFVVWVVFTY